MEVTKVEKFEKYQDINPDMKIFRRASKLLGSVDIDEVRSINLNFTRKRKTKIFPKRSRTVLPTTSQAKLKRQRKVYCLLTFLLSTLVIIGSVYERIYDEEPHFGLSEQHNMLRIGLVILSGFEIIIIIAYAYNKLMVKKSYKMISKFSSVYQDKDLFYKLSIEIFICMIVIPPYYSYKITIYQLSIKQIITLEDLLLGLVFLRVIHLYKLYHEFSYFNSLKSKFYCDLLQISDTFVFTMRCFFKHSPIISIFIMFSLSPLLFGILLYVFERTVEGSPFTYIWNAFWLISYTQSTIGYGDMTPLTHLGRLSVIISIFLGLFIYSYMVLTLRNKTTLSRSQQKLYKHVKYSSVGVNKLMKNAALLIQSWWILYLKRKVRRSTIKDIYKFSKLLREFSFKRLKETQAINPTLQEEIKRIFDIPVKRLESQIKKLEPVLQYRMNAIRAASKQYGLKMKLKRLCKRLQGAKWNSLKNIDKNALRVSKKANIVDLNSDRVMLKKLRKEAVKKMIINRIEKTSVSVAHSVGSSDDNFYSSRHSYYNN